MTPTEVLLADLFRAELFSGCRNVGMYNPDALGARTYLVRGSSGTVTWTWVDVQGRIRVRKRLAKPRAFTSLARAGRDLLYTDRTAGPSMEQWLTGNVIEYKDLGRDFYFTAKALHD